MSDPCPSLRPDSDLPATGGEAITVVTGLPRSGTSMMMQMLVAGGYPALSDDRRPPDASNPQGYFEYEPVTRLHSQSGWIPQARGRGLKVVAPLLRFLPLARLDPAPLEYRVVFMRRDPVQVVASQLRMLRNLGRGLDAPPSESVLIRAMQQELESADRWVGRHAAAVLHVDYAATLKDPLTSALQLAVFLPGLDPLRSAAAVLGSRGGAGEKDPGMSEPASSAAVAEATEFPR